MFRKLIKEEIQKIVPVGMNFVVEVPENSEHGDYASNVALALGKKEGRNPKDVAEELKNKLLSGSTAKWAKIDIAGPGFLNFFIAPAALVRNNSHELFPRQSLFQKLFLKKKTVLVEYFQLNIAKRPHVGHMRSAVIGDALKRMFQVAGYYAISDTHVGDWGTQFGILIQALKKKSAQIDEKAPFNSLETLYIDQNVKIKADPKLRDQAKEEFVKLERGDAENRKLWRWMVVISMKKLKESAARLGLLPFDEHKGESSYEKDMPAIVKLALKKEVAQKKEDGAVAVDLTSENLDEAVLVKSDGASTYVLRDLATIQYRKNKHNPKKNLYVVDVRQEHHFRQVFSVAEKLGWNKPGEHILYGLLKLPEGAMSTRAGTSVSIDDVLDEAQKRAEKIIEEKNPVLQNKNEVARQVALGALKYFDLSRNRKSDIVFRWDDALSFEGNTGPYIQYTHARLRSILRKANLAVEPLSILSGSTAEFERQLLVLLSRFDEALEDALADHMPSVMAQYVYDVAQKANEFYHAHPVLQESDEAKKQFRLALVSKIAEILKYGLNLLGIEAPEEM